MADIYALTSGRNLLSTNISDFLTRWAVSKKHELSATSNSSYTRVARQFVEHLGEKATADLSRLETQDIATFRDSIAASRSTATANSALKIIRIAFGQAKRDGLLVVNPAD